MKAGGMSVKISLRAMRFVTALEHLRLQQPLLAQYRAGGGVLNSSGACKKQVRAIELMIKGLIQQRRLARSRCVEQPPEGPIARACAAEAWRSTMC